MIYSGSSLTFFQVVENAGIEVVDFIRVEMGESASAE